MKILAIIQARMGSDRLPGKILKKINEKPSLLHTIERLQRSQYINQIVVATTVDEKDKIIEKEVKDYPVKVYYGNIYNVLDRFYQVAKIEQPDIIIRITADNPLIDIALIDKGIEQILKDTTIDYVRSDHYPNGMNIEVFTFKALEKCFKNATEAYEKEHVTPYLYCHADQFHIVYLENDKDWNKYRLTCDTPEDLELIRKICLHFKDDEYFGAKEIISYLEENPELLKINAHIHQKDFKETDKRGGM